MCDGHDAGGGSRVGGLALSRSEDTCSISLNDTTHRSETRLVQGDHIQTDTRSSNHTWTRRPDGCFVAQSLNSHKLSQSHKRAIDNIDTHTMPLLPLLSFCIVLQPSIAWSSHPNHRRLVLESMVATSSATIAAAWLSPSVVLAETIGKDSNCNTRDCLGVWDGLLADCPHMRGPTIGAGCTSSQDDTPGTFAEP